MPIIFSPSLIDEFLEIESNKSKLNLLLFIGTKDMVFPLWNKKKIMADTKQMIRYRGKSDYGSLCCGGPCVLRSFSRSKIH